MCWWHLSAIDIVKCCPWWCSITLLRWLWQQPKPRLCRYNYGLSSGHCAGILKTDDCPLCNHPLESIAHFLLTCLDRKEIRSPIISKYASILEFHFQPRSALCWRGSRKSQDAPLRWWQWCYAKTFTRRGVCSLVVVVQNIWSIIL